MFLKEKVVRLPAYLPYTFGREQRNNSELYDVLTLEDAKNVLDVLEDRNEPEVHAYVSKVVQ